MKFFNFFWVALATLAISSCATPEGEKAHTADAAKTATASATASAFKVDAGASVINWEGAKPTETHIGTLKLTSGTISVKDGNIEAGEFVIDMNSLTVMDKGMDDKGKANLKGHLSNEDFFEVNKYPTAKFVITESKALATAEDGFTHTISGNLTLKAATKNVTFKAKVNATKDGLTAESNKFKIDRTQWAVNYGSPSVFNIKDKFINDEVGLEIKLVASK